MAAPRTFAEVRRRANEPLTAIERAVFERCRAAAKAGEPAPSIEELTEAIGANGVSTVPGIMKRLEDKGYITRTIYQKGRQVCIAATGECTAQPRDTTPHWRFRTENPPAPAIHHLAQRNKPLAQMIEAKARELGKPIHEFLMDCVYVGFHEIAAEEE